MATVTSKGQVTLPKDVRQALGVDTGGQVEFEIRTSEVVLRRRIPDDVFDAWRGYLVGKTPWNSTDEMMTDLRGEQ
jgi:AbrB family looped-hinge helix DNA binding protein